MAAFPYGGLNPSNPAFYAKKNNFYFNKKLFPP